MAENLEIIKVFYSYASKDESLQKEFEKHLVILQRQTLITTWHSRKIEAGTEWRQEINNHLDAAHIILLLISPDFLASDYCYDFEVKRALQRHEAGAARVIPVILRPVYWEDTSFGKLQALPRNGQPITSWPGRHGRDKAFLEVALGIREVITSIRVERYNNMTFGKIPSMRIHAQSTSGEIPLVQAFRATTSAEMPSLDRYIASVQAHRAGVYYERNHYEEALEIYEQAIQLNPDDAISHSGMGDVLSELGRYEEALLSYDQAIRLDPNDAVIHISRGDVLLELGRFFGALDAYEHATHLNPNNIAALYGKGSVLYDLRHYEASLAVFEQIVELSPTYIAAYLGKGNSLQQLQLYREALSVYELILKLNPNHAQARQGWEDMVEKLGNLQ